ncbi:RHS repeat protein [Endozoicomonas sp. SM1973]|uniref:RHS repeat protein n=1 Tax=Spartinivicinus marinus TaxID=2994442 RepID=A0A853I6J1_9GAMM|nr:RHS repeat protein [Spartinivicinus marinus]NYZ66288.1 RHS repeat protein [Spartinivicinus marinus]
MKFTQTVLAGSLAFIFSSLGLASTSSSISYQYNDMGLVSQVDDPRTDVQDITQFHYSEKGQLTEVINALGHTTRLENHDSYGNPQRIVDANGLVTELTYNRRGWLTQASVKSAAGNAITQFTYDGVGQITAVVLPNGSQLNYTYDAARRLTRVSNGLGERIDYQHDNMGNLTQQQVTSATGSVVSQSTQAYDEMGRLLQAVGAGGQTTRFQYDKNSNTTATTNPRNYKTSQAFDGLNRLVEITDALNQVTQLKYDSQDNLTQVTDPRGVATTYQYDGLGRLVKEISPSSGETVYSHDAVGNLTEKTDGRGRITRYRYDALNRLTQRIYPSTPTLNVTYLYDDTSDGSKGIGRLTGIQDQSGLIAYHYDDRGNATKTMRSVSLNGKDQFFGVAYGYNLANQLTRIQYPSGLTISYQRNSNGQVNQVTGQFKGGDQVINLANNIGYVPFGPVQQLTWGNGKTLNRQYDQDLQLTQQTVQGIQELNYQYDPNGNITGIENLLAEQNNSSYGYDPLDRLIEEQANYGRKTYEYDPVGNRTKRTTEKAGKTETQQLIYASNSNQVVRRNEGPFTYDGMGNMTRNGQGLSFKYDGQGRLKAVVKGGTTQAKYRYNAIGERLVKALNSQTVIYSYNQNGQLLEEAYYNASNKLFYTRNYAWLGTQPIAMLEQWLNDKGQSTKQQVAYIHSDHLNTPRVATNAVGQAIWQWQSDAFGVGLANEDVDGDGQKTVVALRFPGQVFDPESGLHYNYFRDYDPNLGRYVQSDPIGLEGGLNTYAYVEGNPLVYFDDKGLNTQTLIKQILGGRGNSISCVPQTARWLAAGDWNGVLTVVDACWPGIPTHKLNQLKKYCKDKVKWDDIIKQKYKSYDKLGAHEKKIADNILDRFQQQYLSGTGTPLSNIRDVRYLKNGIYEIKSKQGVRVYLDSKGNVIGYGNKNSQPKDIPRLKSLLGE